MDFEIEELQREYGITKDPTLLQKIQAHNDHLGPGPKDVEYLEKCIEITHRFSGDEFKTPSLGSKEATELLTKLNEDYASFVCSKTLKPAHNLPAKRLARTYYSSDDDSESWVPSRSC